MRLITAHCSAVLVLFAIGCSGSSSTESSNRDDSRSLSEDFPTTKYPLDPTEARVVASLARIAPYSPSGRVMLANYAEARSIEFVAAGEPAAALPKESQRTLSTAIEALETKLNVAIDNLANAHTPGFKRRRVILSPLIPRHEATGGVQDSAGNLSAVGIAVGQGCKVECVQTDFRPGAIVNTARPLDLALDGDGFFQVQQETGELVYTRVANLNANPNGALVIGSASSGKLIQPPITVPADAVELIISPEGAVAVRQPGVSALSQIGQLQLARFINNDGLRALGGGLYAETDASGPATLATAGQQGRGKIRHGALEASNVATKRELAEIDECRSALAILRELATKEERP